MSPVTPNSVTVVAGTTFETTLVGPGPFAQMGARIEEPITRAIVSAFHFATFDSPNNLWSVTLDAPLDPGGYELVWLTPEDPPAFTTFIPLLCETADQATEAAPDWGPIPQDVVRPDVAAVSRLLKTRVKTEDGTAKDIFDDTTFPKGTDVDALITDAESVVLAELPYRIDPELYPRVKYAITLQAAILVEASFFRTQEDTAAGVIPTYRRILMATMNRLTPAGRYVGLS